MMHLDAIKKRNRRPERQPTKEETAGYYHAALEAATERRWNSVGPLAGRPVYVREV